MPDLIVEQWSAATYAAIAAAFAAICSAFAAISSWLTQRRNLLESIRPEIVLFDWLRQREHPGGDRVSFKIKNIGRGTASRVRIDEVGDKKGTPPAVLFGMSYAPILATNETASINSEVMFWWSSVPDCAPSAKYVVPILCIWCWDYRGQLYQAKYKLIVFDDPSRVATNTMELADGVFLQSHTSGTKKFWLMMLRMKLARVPGVGKLFAERH